MNFKKIFLLLILLLSFLGIGTMLSNIESSYADELLEAHGLTIIPAILEQIVMIRLVLS